VPKYESAPPDSASWSSRDRAALRRGGLQAAFADSTSRQPAALALPPNAGVKPHGTVRVSAWVMFGARPEVWEIRRMIPFNRPERRVNLFGGHGEVLVESLVGELCAPFTVALNCELSPRGKVGEHVQQHEDELCIVLGGEGVMQVNGAPRAVRAGSVVGLKLGQRLSIENTLDVPLRYLIVKAR
jgi:mannose-6-phosphate isomerase-like protein (cupin superfamily)